jgi:hypothetical protein
LNVNGKTDDERYYMELNQNQEYVMRVEMAEIYKRSAIDYMFEAISLYLEQRQERELEGETPVCSFPSTLPASSIDSKSNRDAGRTFGDPRVCRRNGENGKIWLSQQTLVGDYSMV